MSESQDITMQEITEEEIINDDSSLPTRVTTYSIRGAFEEAEEDDNFKTNLKHLHNDTCFCMSPYDDPTDISILVDITGKQCGHALHKECLNDYLNSGSIECPMCRVPIEKISMIEWGLISVSEFQERYETEIQLFAMPIGISRQVTGGGFYGRQNTLGGYSHFQEDDSRYSKNGIALPAIPIFDTVPAIRDELNYQNATSLFSTPFPVAINGIAENLATFAFIAPYQESELSELNADIILILDVSGSMAGERIEKCKEAIKMMIDGINGKSRIRVSLITFDDYAVQEFPLGIISPSNYDNIINIVDSISDRGGTNYNVAFELLNKILTDRDLIIFFFSDGEPSNPTDLSILRSIYASHPQLTMYVISIGADVVADKALIPLLCDRYHEVAVYRHFSELSAFPQFIGDVIGETTGIYATDVNITFGVGTIPISSKCETTQDGISSIFVPVIRFNDMIQFAFTQSDILQPIIIRIEYSINGDRYMIASMCDDANLLGEILSKNFALKRFLDRECNTIRYRTDLKNSTKQEMLRNILSSITMEQLGTFYDEFKSGLEHLIESFELISTRKQDIRNTQNTLSQIHNRSGSVGRQVSSSVARAVSEHQPLTEEDMEEEES
jgi:uncharacterized protein YegL